MRQEITYIGAIPSLNVLYTSHWSKANKLKDAIKEKVKTLIEEAQWKPVEQFKIEVEYNSRLDPDNVVGFCKAAIDQSRYSKILIDDTKKYYKGLSIIPNESMPKNHYRIVLVEV
jgi:hypothetical protein